ncbi:MAG: hypothetical protein MJ252_19785 [archaeon]|nr:hypothetical protein [archaeon]
MPKCKNGTGRIVIYRETGLENILCLENSYFGCLNGKYAGKYFTPKILCEIGRDICLSILYNDYYTKNKNGIPLNIYSAEEKGRVLIQCKEIETEYNNFINKKNDIIKEEKGEDDEGEKAEEDGEKAEDNDDDSESDPSEDNIEEEEIIKLLPKQKKGKKKGKKGKGKNNIKDLILAVDKKKEEPPPPKVENKKQLPLPKLKINSPQNKNNLNPKQGLNLLTPKNKIDDKNHPTTSQNENKKNTELTKTSDPKSILDKIELGDDPKSVVILTKTDSECQTEEIYFKMHWSYFVGMCKILGPTLLLNASVNLRGGRSFRSFGLTGGNRPHLGNFYQKNASANKNKYMQRFDFANINGRTNESRGYITGNTSSNNNIVQGHFVIDTSKRNVNLNPLSSSVSSNENRLKIYKSGYIGVKGNHY